MSTKRSRIRRMAATVAGAAALAVIAMTTMSGTANADPGVGWGLPGPGLGGWGGPASGVGVLPGAGIGLPGLGLI